MLALNLTCSINMECRSLCITSNQPQRIGMRREHALRQAMELEMRVRHPMLQANCTSSWEHGTFDCLRSCATSTGSTDPQLSGLNSINIKQVKRVGSERKLIQFSSGMRFIRMQRPQGHDQGHDQALKREEEH